jgi:hypothetical protein
MAIISGSKRYDVCRDCGEIVQVNKPILGSIHVCTDEDDREKDARQIQKRIEQNRSRLRLREGVK